MDVGTDSVGIASTDENYNLLRAKGKDLWAVRLFEEATTAEKRRLARTARRRLTRRRERIDLLQEIFSPFLDNKFFLCLNNSGFLYEDKDEKIQSPYSLFADEKFCDKDFYKQFPTIFHLRRTLLCDKTQKFDLRLYYLAIHHIVKYRGHFLYEGKNWGEDLKVVNLFNEANEIAKEVYNDDAIPHFLDSKVDEFVSISLNIKSQKDREKAACELFCTNLTTQKAAIKLLLGGKVKLSDLFLKEEYKSEDSISFKDISEEKFNELQSVLDSDWDYLDCLKRIYDFILCEKILKGRDSISDAMVEDYYKKHSDDLKVLKKLILDNLSHDDYIKVFKSTNIGNNYANYIGYTKKNRCKVQVKKCSIDDFYKFLKNEILAKIECSEKAKILADIDNQNFLPKIINADNGRFPRQLNGAELQGILQRLVENYPEFAIKDEDGFSATEKIVKLFEFKIPYYVGPLNPHHVKASNSWAERIELGRVLPWNFDKKIDCAASNQAFMRRMTNKCSYLYHEDVLPQASIIFQRYNTLNQLNKLKINEKPISVELKQALFNNLFCEKKKVTQRDIKEYLVNHGYVPKIEQNNIILGGFDGEINASMSSYILLKNILGDFVNKHLDVCEDIILWHTIHTDSKTMVEKLLKEKYSRYPAILENIKVLKGITSFKKFATLSKKLLCELYGGVDDVTGEMYTILGELYNTNSNLNEILYDKKYTFGQEISKENGEDDEVSYDTLREMRLPPQVCRGVWQAIKMTDEYVNAIGCAPKKIFVEVTRAKDKNPQRSVSRKNELLTLYKDIKNVDKLLEQLNKKSDRDLQSERWYLYFKQLGKCAYSGQTIELDSLNSDTYDVDHIMPRSIIKDDSLDNKVLVYRECNAKKTNIYPVPQQFRQIELWKLLKEKKLLSEKKYALLTRTDELSDADYHEFINRQIVTTGQTAKAVAEILKRKYEELGTKIVYAKAINTSDFKSKFNIVKCRETNDLHHARDAYLNIVVGNVYDTKFTSARDYFYRTKNSTWHECNLEKLFDKNIDGTWDKSTSITTIKRTLSKPSMAVTRFSYKSKGEFYNQTIYKKTDEGVSIPRKDYAPYNDVKKYGGYKGLSTSYFAVVQSKGKKGTITTIEAIPILVDYRSKTKQTAVVDYLKNELELIDPKITNVLLIKSLLCYNGTPLYLAGVTNPRLLVHNAIQWFTDNETDRYIKGLVKLLKMFEENKIDEKEKNADEFKVNTNRFGDPSLVVDKKSNIALYDKILLQLEKKPYQAVAGMVTFSETLKKRKNEFCECSTLDQAKVLIQCVKFLKCNAETADLSLIKEGKGCGSLKISKNITDKNVEVIHLSPCGLIERRVKL